MNSFALYLAQTQGQPKPIDSFTLMLPAMLAAMIVFMFLSSRSQRKREKREREEMYAAMAKNDRVQTIGGVIGTVISVKDNEVVLKVDESTNTKMTFIKSAIQKISTEGTSTGSLSK